MGTSFTTTHIRNAQNLTKAQFKKAFTDMMKAKGYTASDEENAALTYTLAFSPDRKWVTVLTDGDDTRREAAELAKALKMNTVMIELVDSDFAELSLFDEAGTHKDTLTLGNSYLEDAAPMGDPAAWQPLLSGSWEQVREIQNGSYTFAEDALAQFAPLIGMNSGDILLDNDSAANDNNAVVLHFKKTAEKKLTLNSAFVKVFGEALEPLGFVKVKSKYPYFVRNVGNELFHVISYYQINSNHPTIKEYVIVGGVVSVYRKEINLSISPKHNSDWLLSNFAVYNNLNPHNNDYEFRKSIYSFSCDIEDPNSVLNSFCNSFEITKNILLSEIDKAADIDSFIRYLHRMNIQTSYIDKETEYFDPDPISSYDEGMVYFFTKKYISLICDDFDRFLSDYKEQLKKNVQGYTIVEYEERVKRAEQNKNSTEKKYREVISDADLFKKIMEESRNRKEANLQYLNSIGISID